MSDHVNIDQRASVSVVKTPILAKKCLDNICNMVPKLDSLPNIFVRIATDAAEQNLPTATLVIGMCEDTVGVLPRQYVAELHLVVYRMPDDKDPNENIPVHWQSAVQQNRDSA